MDEETADSAPPNDYAVFPVGFLEELDWEPDIYPTLRAAQRGITEAAERVAELLLFRGDIDRKGDEALIPFVPSADFGDDEYDFFKALSTASGATRRKQGRMPWKKLLRRIARDLVEICEHEYDDW
jgi:hypothetical protein